MSSISSSTLLVLLALSVLVPPCSLPEALPLGDVDLLKPFPDTEADDGEMNRTGIDDGGRDAIDRSAALEGTRISYS